MTTARRHQVSLNDTRYYHCISRCVRRAFLCGLDTLTKRNFDHRKEWLVERFHKLTEAFAIRICAYCVMSNHYHLVLYVDTDQAALWTEEEVANRWSMIFKSNEVKPNKSGIGGSCESGLSQSEIKRRRLQDISWFMRGLNEYIARKANKEDQCKGRFWEGRFKSQALVDEGAVLACMAYVDLNPIRAGLATLPEKSEFTSILERIREHRIMGVDEDSNDCKAPLPPKTQEEVPRRLMAFRQQSQNLKQTNRLRNNELPLPFSDYLELLDWTGRQLTSKNKGSITSDRSPILNRLKLNHEGWLQSVTKFEGKFFRVAGKLEKLKELGQKLGVKWLKGQNLAVQLYLSET